MDKVIRDNAAAYISKVAKWSFIPRGKLCLIRDENNIETIVYTGRIKYNNRGYEFGYVIRIDDWIFCTEHMIEEYRVMLAPDNDPNVWVISAFNKEGYYTFATITPGRQKHKNILLEYIFQNFWNILRPEFRITTTKLRLQVKPLTSEEKYNLIITGGIDTKKMI